jgi:hypothetical protein
MSPRDAVYLDNLFPRTSDVLLRKGYTTQATLPNGKEIRTLIGYKKPDGTAQLFAVSQAGAYDVTTPGSSPSSQVFATTNGDWQYINCTTAGGNFALACNGIDNAKTYNGTTWSDSGWTGPALNTIAHLAQFKTRVIACVVGSLSFWYGGVNSVSGALTEFPLGALFKKGGYLMATASWSVTGTTAGPQEYFVAITSEGEVAVYNGTDPSSAASFALVGIYMLGKPMSRRCFTKTASDILVLCRNAVYALSRSLQSNDDSRRLNATSRKIEKAYAEFADTYQSLYGWQIINHAEQSMLIVNVPIVNYTPPGSSLATIITYQFVMNTMTGAWCRFLNVNAECWETFNGNIYCALHNVVYQFWTGNNDNGGAITAQAKTAFSLLGTNRVKKVQMLQPLVKSNLSLTLQLGVDMDYNDNTFGVSSASYVQQISLWNSAKWNAATWNGNASVLSQWRSVASKVGRAAAIRLRVSAKDVTMSWIATNMLAEDGGVFG